MIHHYAKRLPRTALVLLLGIFSACTATYKQQLDFNPAEPLRVAVLPFVSVNEKGDIVEEESRLLIDNISLISSKQEETPPQIVRRFALSELEKTNLDLVAPALIDIDLPHHGYARADGHLDMQKVLATKPADICERFLNCDAIMYGKIVRWDRSYYGIQTVNTVGVRLELVSAKTGKTIFSATAEDSDSRGLSKGPTGFSDLALEPIRALDSDIIVALARNVVKKMIDPLNAKSKPTFLESAPPSIFAVSHDVRDGVVDRKSSVIVLMLGSEHQNASFSIGSAVEHVPMIERAPGHYYGEYIPLPTDSFAEQGVNVYLTDKYNRTTERPVELKALSLAALATGSH